MQQDYFANQGTEIYYDDQTHIIMATYKGVVSYNDWVEHLDYALELIKKYNLTKWISDTRNAKVISIANQKYFAEEFTPKLNNTYLVATIVSKDAFNEFGTKQLMKKFSAEKAETQSGYFQTIEEAVEWLQSN